MERYDSYKDSGVKWLGEIPSHWTLLPGLAVFKENKIKNTDLSINTVLSLSYGKIIVKKNIDEGLVPADYNTYQIVHPGYIIIRCTDLQNDKVSLRTGIVNNDGIITSAYLGLTVNAEYNSSYIHYFLHSWDITKEIYRYGSGLRQSLSWLDLRRLSILLPSINEQNAIVNYLDTVTSKIDEAIAQQQKMIDLLNERKQIIINNAVTKGLDPNVKMKPSGIEWIGDIPENWEVIKLKHLASLKGRIGWNGLRSEEFEEKSYAYLVTGQDFIDSTINWEKCYQISKKRYDEDPFIQLSNGDLLITKDGTIGKIAKVEGLNKPACLNSGIFVMKQTKSKYNQDYLYWMLCSIVMKEYVNYTQTGATILHLYQNVFEQMPCIIPPKEIQTSIGNYLNTKCSNLENTIESYKRKISLLQERKQIIINDVVTGKVKVV